MTAMALQMVAGLGLEDKSRHIARRHKAMNKDGRYVGPRPYGYRLVRRAGQNGFLKVDAEEARIVGLIYRSYLDGMSLPAIVKKLNETSVPPPRGEKWKMTMLSQDGDRGVLHDKIYIGLVVCGMYEMFEDDFTEARHRVLKPRADWSIAKGQHEPIVPVEIFDAVQKRDANERSAA
ncbi:recombinase family protein [Bradyrhizobium sp. USDA 4452]